MKIETLDQAEKRLMEKALKKSNYHVESAHRLLCPEVPPFLTLRSLYRRLYKHNLKIEK